MTDGLSPKRSERCVTSRIWVRFLCLLLCLTVLLPCVSAMAETAKVKVYLLRLRAAASDKSRVIDAYGRGTVVTVLKKGTEWTKVRVHNKTGYMKTSMLKFKNSSSDSGSSSSGGSGSTMYVAKDCRLYLRAEPDSNSEILGTFRGGTAVTVLKKGKYWYKVSVKGLEGYMGKDYLVEVKGQTVDEN